MKTINHTYSPDRQRGVALVMAMVFLMILTIIGVTALGTSSLQEKMAGNVQDKHVAFQAAESALRVGETFLQASTNAALQAEPFDGTTTGLYQPAATTGPPQWALVDWTDCAVVVCLPGGTIANANTQPKYIIEQFEPYAGTPPTQGGTSLGVGFEPPQDTGGSQNLYRVTAQGTGGTDAAVAVVQSVFRR